MARLRWPILDWGDDDGDSRPDLFVGHRFGVLVFRGNDEGIAALPSRTLDVAPFPLDEELRHELTAVRWYPRDLDGDGLTDLVVHRNSGTLLGSHASTRIHANAGEGANPLEPPAAELLVARVASELRDEARQRIDRLEALWQATGTFLDYSPRPNREP